MNELKHTPSPWAVGKNFTVISTSKNRGLIAEIYSVHENSSKQCEEVSANTHLIAAAPELLEALECLVDGISGLILDSGGLYGFHYNGDNAPWEEIIDGGKYETIFIEKAKSAIAKARGKNDN